MITNSAMNHKCVLDLFLYDLCAKLDSKPNIKPLELRDWRSLGIALANLPKVSLEKNEIKSAYFGERISDLIKGFNLQKLRTFLKNLSVLPEYIPIEQRDAGKQRIIPCPYPYLLKAISSLNPSDDRDEAQLQKTKREIIKEIINKTKFKDDTGIFLSSLIKLAIIKLDLEILKKLMDKADEIYPNHKLAQEAYNFLFAQNLSSGQANIFSVLWNINKIDPNQNYFLLLNYLIQDRKVSPGSALGSQESEIERIANGLRFGCDRRYDTKIKEIFASHKS